MVRYLLHRPIAVCVIALALSLLGLLALQQLPVSLLPDIPVPEITVQVSYPNAAARELQRTVEQPLRNQLLQVNHLDDISGVVQDGLAVLTLRFDYGTNIRLAYLETNEKIDGILSRLPRDLERPKVIKAGAGDIPVFNLNVFPKDTSREDFLAFSEFCENVLKRRIEQLPDVALVDATGLAQPEVVVEANPGRMNSLGLTEQQLVDLLRQANLTPGNFTVREGQYQYNIRFSATLQTSEDVEKLVLGVGAPRRLIALRDIAKVSLRERSIKGEYFFEGPPISTHRAPPRRAICLSIIKQSDAQLLHLRQKLHDLLNHFKEDYPQLAFQLSQDQTELLDVSISNLISSLLTGALLTFVLIFFFMRDRLLPILIGLVMPVSLSVTFLGFYVFELSVNIVSLAGLILGIGEIIDSAIIILENIEEQREKGLNVENACVQGTEEVIRPLFTSVLTNSAVFLPLLLLSGLAGALFYDQAVSVSLALGISLLCSYTLVPVLYFLLYRKVDTEPSKPLPSATWLMRWTENAYHRVFTTAFRSKKIVLLLVIGLLVGGGWMAFRINKQGMPTVSRTELEVYIDWNEPLTVTENANRTQSILKQLTVSPVYASLFAGQQQFLLNRRLQQSENESLLSLRVSSQPDYHRVMNELVQKIQTQYPSATVDTRPAQNIFEQLFNTTEPALRLKLYSARSQQVPSFEVVNQLTRKMNLAGLQTTVPNRQLHLSIQIRADQLLLYDVAEDAVIQVLKTVLNNNQISLLQNDQRFIPLVLSEPYPIDWQHAPVYNRQKHPISLLQLIDITRKEEYKVLHADKEGVFVPVNFTESVKPVFVEKVTRIVKATPEIVSGWSGRYFKDRTYLKELAGILFVSFALLFCILTAQFESLQQPLIVLLIILLGLSGAMWLLYLVNESINVLSVIGMVVLIGLLDNDSILKIDTMNRSRGSLSLVNAIRQSGLRRLKSQIMTFLTTILGLLPVLFSGGLGAELQRPLALCVIGGMFIGVLVSWTVIPLLYWGLAKMRI